MLKLRPSNISQRKRILTFIFLLILNYSFSQINVTTDRPDAYYEVGETANFNITSQQSGQVIYVLKYDNYAPPIQVGALNINAGQTLSIPYTSSDAGIVICNVVKDSNNVVTAAAFSPYEIEPFEEEPSDFDAFWNQQKNILAGVPMDAQLTYHSSTDYSSTYRVNLGNIANRRVYGYVSIPVGQGPFPAVITFPPFGTIPNITAPEELLAENANVISMTISVHNVEPDLFDPNSYQPDDYANREGLYYKYAIMGGIRAVDYIFSRNDFDGQNLGVTGVSQGAGLSTIIAGLDDRVTFLMQSNPVLAQNTGQKYNRATGFPNYINRSRNEVGTAAHEAQVIDAIKYYDAIYFARRFEGTSLTVISYEDVVTPAATSLGVFNALKGTKILAHFLNLGHAHPVEYWVGRLDFIRRFVPGTTNPPFPFAPSNKGYFIDAGNDILSPNNMTVNLSATIQKHNVFNPNYDLQWEKISGPGVVNFSNPKNYNTTATFSTEGVYTLRLRANDFSNVYGAQKYFTLMDDITVTVEEPNLSSQNITFDGIPEKITTDDPFAINATASSGLPVSFEMVSGPAYLNNNIVTLTGYAGTVSIKAIQNGNNQYEAAPEVIRIFEVKEPQNNECLQPPNIALNGSVTQSGTQLNAIPERAIDGNRAGDFWLTQSVTLTNWQNQPWLELDLGEVSTIKKIDLWNREDCCEDIFKDYYVLVSNEPFTSNDLNETISQSGVQSFHNSGIAGRPSSFSMDITGRYVRVQLAGQGFLALAEIEVMGCQGSGQSSNTFQNIHFPLLSNKTTTDNPFTINATASSGLPVFFEMVSGPAYLTNGNTVVLIGAAGTVTIKATQPGNNQYATAQEIFRTFEVLSPQVVGCSNTFNIAKNTLATQSGTQSNGEAARAVDGNTNGNYYDENSVTLTDWVQNAWWETDLGVKSNIENIHIWNRVDCCEEFLKDVYVLVSDVPFISQELDATIAQAGVSSYLIEGMVGAPSVLNIDRTGRYVRVQLQGMAFLSLAEVEIIGCSAEAIDQNGRQGFEEDKFTLSESVLIFPNPTNDYIQVRLKSLFFEEKLDIQVLTRNGRVLLERKVIETSLENLKFYVHDFPEGIYFIKVRSDGKREVAFPFMVVQD